MSMKVFAAALLAAVALLIGGDLWASPAASADVYQDRAFISLMVDEGIGPAAGYSWSDLCWHGWFVGDAVRRSADPVGTAVAATRQLYLYSSLTAEQSAYVVVAAIYVYAPEMLPVISAQLHPRSVVVR